MTATRVLLGTALLIALAGSALAGGYVAGGTFVVKDSAITGATILDNGGAICQGLSGGGVGGGCLPLPLPGFPGSREGGFVEVVDNSAGHNVAFQVCLDNNGDGVCGGPQTDPFCRDQIFFSHSDGGVFHNPLGPLPPRTQEGCFGAFQGYIVLLCQGEHNDPQVGAHTHSLTTGTIQAATTGTGYGNFCGGGFGGISGPAGGNVNAAAKKYVVV